MGNEFKQNDKFKDHHIECEVVFGEDCNWAIDDWLEPCKAGLHGLYEHHGFRIARQEVLDNEVCIFCAVDSNIR